MKPHSLIPSVAVGLPTESLPQSWLAFVRDPQNQSAIDQLGRELDRTLGYYLPGRSLSGILRGHEADIRQEAWLLLTSRYLAGNRGLGAATRRRARSSIYLELRRSTCAAIRTTIRKLRRKLIQEARYFSAFEALPPNRQPACIHSAERWRLGDLPYALQQQLALAALRRAVAEMDLDPKKARMMKQLIDGERTQAQLAKEQGVSRAAIHQQLVLLRSELKATLEKEEFPLS